MYADDSFFTLSGAGQVGLLALSALLAGGVVTLAIWLMRGRSKVVASGIAVFLFGVFVWVSPQVYYAYYRLIFDGLPAQWVIGWPPLHDMLRYASFSGPANLSAHSQGLMFWGLVALALRVSAGRDRRR